MSRENGQLRTCNRCGKQIFLKCNGEGEMDGGFTRWNTFDQTPAKGWDFLSKIGDVCPGCYAEYTRMFNQFKDGCKYLETEVVD